MQAWKSGQTIHGKFTKMRNAGFHRRFFKMLDLAFDYFEPVGGLVPRQEMRGIQGLAKFFEQASGKPGQLSDAVAAYIAQLEQDRAERFPAVDKSREAFREWVTIEAGHFHLVRTPDGVRKEAKSISWSAMDETAFQPLYRDVFNACWRLVLSAHFESEEAAMSAADQMGNFA
jgi:Protein of unknown function (DUF1367).